jgi:hypothetical protein
VQQGGSLSLMGVALAEALMVQGGNATVSGGAIFGAITVASGGRLHLMNAVSSQVTAETGATVVREASGSAAQCTALAGHYTNLSDAWRATSHGDGSHSDCSFSSGGTDTMAREHGGGGWYRCAGGGGDALPLTRAGMEHCGTSYGGWLSGWGASDRLSGPPQGYSTPGHYPALADGVAEMTACFDQGDPYPCYYRVAIGVLRCENSPSMSFLLWRLPYSPTCGCAYCTAPSGL